MIKKSPDSDDSKPASKDDCVEIFDVITPERRSTVRLVNNCNYKGDKKQGSYAGDVICKLFTGYDPAGVHGTRNQGGFRYIFNPHAKKGESPYLAVILFSTGKQRLWRDEADADRGVYAYYGDQNKPNKDILDTPMKGNLFLSNAFALAATGKPEDRKKIPPIFIFDRYGGGSFDFYFRGLAFPGVSLLPKRDWLTAFYLRENRLTNPVLNFKALFTIANLKDGCDAFPGHSSIPLEWLTDIEMGHAYDSKFAPKAWKEFCDEGLPSPIVSKMVGTYISPKDQMPSDKKGIEMLQRIYDFFSTTTTVRPYYSFESFACKIVQMLNPGSISEVMKTPDFRDGGIDGIGSYTMFTNDENKLTLSFFVQAKCYEPRIGRGVNTKDMARLISRIKTHDFGVMVTSSYIDKQAWEEVVADGHPVAFVTGRDIVNCLVKNDIDDIYDLDDWLDDNFGAMQ